MRIVKQRLKELLPKASVFLDVDDLEEIGRLEMYVERTSVVLVFCSDGYFRSKNCMRELITATKMKKPIIPLLDTDTRRGGLTMLEVRSRLSMAESLFKSWGLSDPALPSCKELYEHLFAHEPIEWNRLGHFQDVTIRLIAERLLPDALAGQTFVGRELCSQPFKSLPKPGAGARKSIYHVYCSQHNPGARELMEELAVKLAPGESKNGSRSDEDPVGTVSPPAKMAKNSPAKMAKGLSFRMGMNAQPEMLGQSAVLIAPSDIEHLCDCDHMVLYLNAQTWTRGTETDKLVFELQAAIDQDVHILLAHESTRPAKKPNCHARNTTLTRSSHHASQCQASESRKRASRASSASSSRAPEVRRRLHCSVAASTRRLQCH